MFFSNDGGIIHGMHAYSSQTIGYVQNSVKPVVKSIIMPKKLFLHLPKHTQNSVDSGQHNFFNILQKAFEGQGFTAATKLQTKHGGTIARLDRHYHIFDINGASGPRSLNVRKAHFYPFWSLENAGNRYAPRISQLEFNPSEINGIVAQDFFNKICVRNLPAHPEILPKDDFVFIPLQGRLLKQRKWQFSTTNDMINTVLAQEPNRQILVKPHPREDYTAAEKSYIQALSEYPRITITERDTFSLLSQCAYVATQNSAVAFTGFLYQKPAILFANADFHHICQTVKTSDQAAEAFQKISETRPDFEKYIYWYLQMNCINAGRDNAVETILNMARNCGWQV